MTSRPEQLEQQCRLLVERLRGRWRGDGGMVRCPVHDDRTPSLSLRAGRTRILVHCFAGCSPRSVLEALALERCSGGPATDDRHRPGASHRHRSEAAARRLWSAARPLPGSPVQLYLAGRGIVTATEALRFHPRTPQGPRPMTRFQPAMIAAVRDECGLVAVHRTFLVLRHGASPLARGRQGLGRFGRGAVRMGGAAARLGLAEGIETALSATALFDMPCWATLGAARFGRVALPRQVRELHLFLDHDEGGRRAEAIARAAHGGHMAIVSHYPARPGSDWNDVLRMRPVARSDERPEG